MSSVDLIRYVIWKIQSLYELWEPGGLGVLKQGLLFTEVSYPILLYYCRGRMSGPGGPPGWGLVLLDQTCQLVTLVCWWVGGLAHYAGWVGGQKQRIF